MDLLPKLGISLMGIETKFPSDEIKPVKPPVNDSDVFDLTCYEKLSLKETSLKLEEIDNNEREYKPLVAYYGIKLKEGLSDAFRTNSELRGFCQLSDAVIEIDTQGANPINKRQYLVPHTKMLLMAYQKC